MLTATTEGRIASSTKIQSIVRFPLTCRMCVCTHFIRSPNWIGCANAPKPIWSATRLGAMNDLRSAIVEILERTCSEVSSLIESQAAEHQREQVSRARCHWTRDCRRKSGLRTRQRGGRRSLGCSPRRRRARTRSRSSYKPRLIKSFEIDLLVDAMKARLEEASAGKQRCLVPLLPNSSPSNKKINAFRSLENCSAPRRRRSCCRRGRQRRSCAGRRRSLSAP